MTELGQWVAGILALFAGIFPTASADYIAPLPQPVLHAPAQVSVLFGGDMLFDRSVRTVVEEKGGDFIFSCIDPILQESDLVVANLEGPITEHPSRSVGSEVGTPDNFTFTFAPSTAELLHAHGIRIVNIGNNHILNFEKDGVRSTIFYLTSAGVGHFGDPLSSSFAKGSFGGVPLSFINYNAFVNSGEASTTIAHIQEARAQGHIRIVYTHWGIEYATTSSTYMQALAHRFVDAGAAIIIGSHPHVVQEHEVYHGVPIYYSLGNFIFDQYWNEDVRKGLLLRIVFTSAGVGSIEEIPIEMGRDRRTCPMR